MISEINVCRRVYDVVGSFSQRMVRKPQIGVNRTIARELWRMKGPQMESGSGT